MALPHHAATSEGEPPRALALPGPLSCGWPSACDQGLLPPSESGDRQRVAEGRSGVRNSPPTMAMSEVELEADVAKSSNRVLTYMNDDHADPILAYALAYGEGCEAAQSAVISSLNSKGFVLTVALPGGDDDHRNTSLTYNKTLRL